jgi:fused signal recognition particle receptor
MKEAEEAKLAAAMKEAEEAKLAAAMKEAEEAKLAAAMKEAAEAKLAAESQQNDKPMLLSKKTWFSRFKRSAVESPTAKAKPDQVQATRLKDSGRGNQATSRKKAPAVPAAVVLPRVLPTLRPITPNVPGLPAAPMTLAPTR